MWNPSPDLYNRMYDVQAAQSKTLLDILSSSCQLRYHEEASLESMEMFLKRQLRHMTELFPGGRLRGMIVCGPLVSRFIPPWLVSEFKSLSERGLQVDGQLNEPEAGRLWYCADCDDPIAEGAAIYGRKTLAKIPTYLDTMPQVSILAQGRGQYTWVPLLDAQEVLGGDEFKDTIHGKFQLDRGRRKLHVYLCKGPLEKAPNQSGEPLDDLEFQFKEITSCQASLLREIVRKLGSVEAVRQWYYFNYDSDVFLYSLAFAKDLFPDKSNSNEAQPVSYSAKTAKTPLRSATFDFQSAPSLEVALDVDVRMRPASGLARVELVPEDASFLQGRCVRLNYSTMRESTKLPRLQRGWPRNQELVVDIQDSVLLGGRQLVEIFENTSPEADEYINIIDNIRNSILKGKTQQTYYGFTLWLHGIDQDGQACTGEGNDIIKRIASKFQNDFRRLDIDQSIALKNKLFSRAAWLYTSTPQNINTYIKDILADDVMRREWLWATDAASRSFVKEKDFRILFKAIARRARIISTEANPFPIQVARAICRILMFRTDGEKGLDRDIAQLFARRAMDKIKQEQQAQKFSMLYFQLVRLLFYLLRFRKTDPSCFDPKSPISTAVFDRAKKSMAGAKEYFSRRHMRSKAVQIQNIIDGFDRYLNYEGTEDVLTVLGDLAGDGV